MVVEELDQGDVARGVAGDRVVGVAEDLVALLGDRRLLPGGLRCLLPLLQLLDRLVDDLGLAQQVVADDLLDLGDRQTVGVGAAGGPAEQRPASRATAARWKSAASRARLRLGSTDGRV